jgi:hypothetical protein
MADIGDGFVNEMEADCTAMHIYDTNMSPNENIEITEVEAKRKLKILVQQWER